MGDPELSGDEKVLVRTPGVYVKSIPFEGILTNKRIILIDRAKNLLPTKEIPLVTIKGIEPGENAIRDQIITLSVITKNGELRQMILTFSRQAGGNRIKERDAWVRMIKENVPSSSEQVIRKVIPGPAPRKVEPASGLKYEIVHSTLQPTAPTGDASPEIDGMSPVRRSSITSTAAPLPSSPAVRPSAVSQLVSTVLCSNCGNKIPAESVFCNRCGSRIAQKLPGTTAVQIPVTPSVPKTPATRPIDEEIRSIEPLIEPSAERIPPDALRAVPAEPSRKQTLSRDDKEESATTIVPDVQKPDEKFSGVPEFISTKSATAPAAPPPAPSAGGMNDTPPPPKPPKRGGFMPVKKSVFTAAIALIAILLIAAVAMFVLPILSGGDETIPPATGDITTTPAPTPSIVLSSGTVVIRETQTPVLPATGVYVHVNYLGGFKGSYGIPDMITTVPGNSGDRVWEVENATGTVQATFEKLDGSSHELLVEIYKDGKTLTSGTTTVGHGSVALSVDTATGIAAAPVTSGGSTVKTTTSAVVKTTTSGNLATPTATTTTVQSTTIATTTTMINTITVAP